MIPSQKGFETRFELTVADLDVPSIDMLDVLFRPCNVYEYTTKAPQYDVPVIPGKDLSKLSSDPH